jgi:hypothetical protein
VRSVYYEKIYFAHIFYISLHSLYFFGTIFSFSNLLIVLTYTLQVLVHLVRAGAELAEWKFLPSLMLLHGAHTRLLAWEHSLSNREVFYFKLLKAL